MILLLRRRIEQDGRSIKNKKNLVEKILILRGNLVYNVWEQVRRFHFHC